MPIACKKENCLRRDFVRFLVVNLVVPTFGRTLEFHGREWNEMAMETGQTITCRDHSFTLPNAFASPVVEYHQIDEPEQLQFLTGARMGM